MKALHLVAFFMMMVSVSFADDVRDIEVSVVSKSGVISKVWVEAEGNYTQAPKYCLFSVSSNGGKTWTDPFKYKNSAYDYSANPTTTIDRNGHVHSICMSLRSGYKSGLLEHFISKDRGISWQKISEPIKIESGFADKPWIVNDGAGTLAISFSGVPRPKESDSGELLEPIKIHPKIIFSEDYGRTWSNPIDLKFPSYMVEDQKFIQGYQGTWLDYQNGAWHISFGEYYGGKIVYCSNISIANLCQEPKAIAPSETLVPVTQYFNRHGFEGVVWSDTHSFGETALSISDNGVWSKKIIISDMATNAFVQVLTENLLAVLFTEIESGSQSAKTQIVYIKKSGEILKKVQINDGEQSMSNVSYMGAYQSLIVEAGVLMAFWISYEDNEQKLLQKSIELP